MIRKFLWLSAAVRTAAGLCYHGYDPTLRYIVQMLAVTDDARPLLTAHATRSVCEFLGDAGLFRCTESWSDGIAGYRISSEDIVPRVRTFVGTGYANVTYLVAIDSRVEPPAGIRSANQVVATDCNSQGGDTLILSRRLLKGLIPQPYASAVVAYVIDDGLRHADNVADIVARQGVRVVTMKPRDDDGDIWVSNLLAVLDEVLLVAVSGDVALITAPTHSEYSADVLRSYVRRLTDSGVVVVTAAGNGDHDACDFVPGNMPEVITVGAAGWAASNRGSCIDLWANGTEIAAAGSTYSGTAQAAATVAGQVAGYIGSYGGWSREGFFGASPPVYGAFV